MKYSSPGTADQLSQSLSDAWNAEIQRNYQNILKGQLNDHNNRSPDFSIDPTSVGHTSSARITWFGSPAEPEFCQNKTVAQELSDWGSQGRHGVQNEYCEYAVIWRTDTKANLRPKRVEVTTELREYWCVLAMQDPAFTRELAARVLGIPVSYHDLYGMDNPEALTETQRLVSFSKYVAGNGQQDNIPKTVGPDPIGSLNNQRALFMSHPINGLDDLIYIVMFGAYPYAVKDDAGNLGPARREDIFTAYDVKHLSCRHADPAAAMGAYGAVNCGQTVAFTDPLGMYIRDFSAAKYSYRNNPIPASWIRYSRGAATMYQRLEFGPSDQEDAFLDDIVVSDGVNDLPVTGGYQVVQNIEVGPPISIGDPKAIDPTTRLILPTAAPIVCAQAEVCKQTIAPLKEQYDRAHGGVRVAGFRQ